MRRSHGRRTGGPRSSVTRGNIAMRATGWSPTEIQMRILKGLWSAVGPKPKWAKLAYARHWMTFAAYLQVENEPGPTFVDLLYAESPFFKMLRRAA